MSRLRAIAPVLFEDDALVAYDKPSGLLVAPDRWDKERENLMDLVHAQDSPGWFNVHRLDKDTSGVVLCAKTKGVLDALCGDFETRAVEKIYVALVRGAPAPAKGRIDHPLAPDPAWPGRMKVDPRGKSAETEYEVLEMWRENTFVKLQPHTGRTHQLRVHLAAIGHAIIADAFYGKGRGLFLSDFKRGYKPARDEERPLMGRLALHAQTLAFRHPVSGDAVTVTSPLPHDFEVALKMLRKFAR